MAKVLGLHGKARGKVGSVVYRTEAGIGTIASEYNPNPRNPRTLAQVKQRNKMNLAGRLSKIISYADIAGLSASPRIARQMFVSNILRACRDISTTGVEAVGGTAIRWQEISFSVGPVHPATISSALAEGTAKLVTSVTFSNTDLTIQGVHFVVIFGNAEEWIGARSFDIPRLGTASVELDLAEFVDDPSELAVVVYAIPVLALDVASRAIYNNYIEGTDVSEFHIQWLRELAQRNALGATQYVTSVTPA